MCQWDGQRKLQWHWIRADWGNTKREWPDRDHVKDDRQGSGCHPVDRQLKLKDGDYLTKSLTICVLTSRPVWGLWWHMWHTWCVSHDNVITISPTRGGHCVSLSEISFYIKVWPRFPNSWWVWASYLMIYISPQSPVMVLIQTQPLRPRPLRSPPGHEGNDTIRVLSH